ncbi:MAG: N-6 DNA methylase [Bacteroidota bacterium]
MEKKKSESKDNLLPSINADNLGLLYSKQMSSIQKKKIGQFFTPHAIATLMASLTTNKKKTIRILDPGCGTLILTCALVEKLIDINKGLKKIELLVYENDKDLLPKTIESIKYLNRWLNKKNVEFTYSLSKEDFVLKNAKFLTSDIGKNGFDIIISNPPYFKLSKDDPKSIAAKHIVNGQPNIYAIFMAISAKMLSPSGELIFITPRSFASGSYFESFRHLLFKTVQLEHIHLFDSRKATFSRDKVLQETIIIKARKETIDGRKNVIISSSSGITDIQKSKHKSFKLNEIVELESKGKILHVPINEIEEALFKLVKTWRSKLEDLKINISTGPVVSFRALNFLSEKPKTKNKVLVPLFWIHNVNKMHIDWPVKYKDKFQYISQEDKSKSLLIPNKDYILLRRFSTKDDNSRLIAAPHFSSNTKADFIGVENKLNYIYRKDGKLSETEQIGLCSLLNSELFNIYFQIFNGNVNVSATELREMRMPALSDIEKIGNLIREEDNYSMKNINRVISNYFKL